MANLMHSAMDWVAARFPATKLYKEHLSEYYAPTTFKFWYLFGSLALLVAERVPAVKAVVTVAANLDLDAWVSYHGYRPLAGSLDPLKARAVAPGCEIHIAAERDIVVPLEQSRQAIARRPASQLWIEPHADHACCWTRRWLELMDRIQHQLQSSRCFADRS